VDIFYYACLVPMHVLFTEDGEMEKRVFLATWKDIPAQNEVQSTITNVEHSAGTENDRLKNGVVLLTNYLSNRDSGIDQW